MYYGLLGTVMQTSTCIIMNKKLQKSLQLNFDPVFCHKLTYLAVLDLFEIIQFSSAIYEFVHSFLR